MWRKAHIEVSLKGAIFVGDDQQRHDAFHTLVFPSDKEQDGVKVTAEEELILVRHSIYRFSMSV